VVNLEEIQYSRHFYQFFEGNYLEEILEKARKGESFLLVDFTKLLNFDPELAEDLLENPEEAIKDAELSLREFDLKNLSKFKLRFFNLPLSQRIMISNIRSEHIGKFLVIEGIVRQKSDVRPQVVSARFECPACGNIIPMLQIESTFREPSKCSCGRKGKFVLLGKELVDAQKIVLEEVHENLEGGEQPKRISIFLKDDLVSPISEKRSAPGNKIRINGLIKEVPITLNNSGTKSVRFDLQMEANNCEPIDETFYDLIITKEEEDIIKELGTDQRILNKLSASIAPSVFGYEKIKEALVLQMMGGVHKVSKDGSAKRGDIHVLLVGDPGAGKSMLLKRVNIVAPKSRYISGKGISAAGLTASVVKDEFLRGWSLEAGAMVLASNGLCCTTEDAEFIKEDYTKMTFKELFKDTKDDLIHPKFKILSLDLSSKKIEPFSIKRAIRIKNDKKVYLLKTRTGRELKLTEDNEVLAVQNSKLIWIPLEKLGKGHYIAVPRQYQVDRIDEYDADFAYLCGLIATDGHIKIDVRQAQTSIYNSEHALIEKTTSIMNKLGIKYNIYVQKKGRQSIIRGATVETKKDICRIYNSEKAFAIRIINFGIPSGNKSKENPLDGKILSYSKKTLCSFMAGVFDGDGSVRRNPVEATITTGIKANARLFQQILMRMGIISTIEMSTNSWHCTVRGSTEVDRFFKTIQCFHPKKINPVSDTRKEVKSRIDVLPNHQGFFKNLLYNNKGQLGKNTFRYIWNYSKNPVSPSKSRLSKLNKLIGDHELSQKINDDILWDKIVSIDEVEEGYVYDFTMEGTNNFIANDIIMHNCIDELDKMSKEDTSAMHEALENQTVSISKANIQATLIARTTVLAAANPKLGRFDQYGIIADQIDLPPALINRFDLIFPIKDLPNKDSDNMMASHILNLHHSPEKIEQEIPTKLLKKYMAYAKQNFNPKLTEGAIEEIKSYYLKMRLSGGEEGIRTIPISARQLDALVRLSEASARIRLSDRVTRKDSKKAIELLEYCLMQVGFDKETGKIDIDRIATGVAASQRSNIMIIKEIMGELEERVGKQIPIQDIFDAAKDKGIEESKTEEVIDKLKRSGDVFEPKRGYLQKIS